jgi:hypothetical protein
MTESTKGKEPTYNMTFLLWRADDPKQCEHVTLFQKTRAEVESITHMKLVLHNMERREAQESKIVADVVAASGRPLFGPAIEEKAPAGHYAWPPGTPAEVA